MNTIYTNFQQDLGELSRGQVILRIVIGATLILYSLSYAGNFANVAWLPLLAVYPVFTGIIGVDPFYLVWQKIFGTRTEYSVISRGLLIATTATLIGIVMFSHGELGWRGILALIAVYPALAAIIGKDPVNGFVEYKQGEVVELQGKKEHKPDEYRKVA